MREFLFNKYTALNYLKSKKSYDDLIKNYKHLIDNKRYELLASKIMNSYVSYNFPWRSLFSKYNVLFHAKGVFNDEIIEAFNKSNDFKIFQYSRTLNKKLAMHFFPDYITHFNFKKSQLKNEIYNCYNFYNEVFKFIKDKKKIDIIYSGNYGAFDESQLALAAINNKIKFVSFHKECIMSSGQQQIYYQISKLGRDNFNGNKILVYNNITKKLLERIDVCDHKKIEICPMVRLDKAYFARKKLLNKKEIFNRITYFYIQPNNQLPSLYTKNFKLDKGILDSEPVSWNTLNTNTNKVIYDIAINNPHIEVIIKCKFQDFEDCKFKISKFGKIPKNLKIIFGSSAISLISKSDVICAFNSTSIIESAVAGKTIISPNFDEAKDARYQKYLIDFGDLSIKVNSLSDLKDQILKNLRKPNFPKYNLSNNDLDVVNFWTSNVDGKASYKLRKKTAEIINNE